MAVLKRNGQRQFITETMCHLIIGKRVRLIGANHPKNRLDVTITKSDISPFAVSAGEQIFGVGVGVAGSRHETSVINDLSIAGHRVVSGCEGSHLLGHENFVDWIPHAGLLERILRTRQGKG